MPYMIGNVVIMETFIQPLTFSIGSEATNMVSISKDKKFIIPKFQREIRWEKEQVLELIRDISSESKFLGNIILSQKNNDFWVIDGQQRITTIAMIIQYLKSKYGRALSIVEYSPLSIETFIGFSSLLKVNFDESMFSLEEMKLLTDTDLLCQLNSYKSIWKTITECELLKSKERAEVFYKNLLNSEVSILIDKSPNSHTSLNYFLDVNLKALILDREDIFKSYLLSRDSADKTINSWAQIKQKSFKMNKMLSYKKAKEYSFMDIIEQYLYCDLYNNKDYAEIKFNSEFKIKTDVAIPSTGSKNHFSGEHIINVIADNEYSFKMLKDINEYHDFCIDIIRTTAPSDLFKSYFRSIDDIKVNVFFSLVKHVLMGDYKIPKAGILKYFLLIKDKNPKIFTQSLEKIYGIYYFAVTFSLFADRKGKDSYEYLTKDNWYSLILDQCKNYVKNHKYKSVSNVKYHYIDQNDCINEHIVRSLAIAYNYFNFSITDSKVTCNNVSDLNEFLNNRSAYSLEHLIVNKKKKYIDSITKKPVKYSLEASQNINSLMNFIFIPKELNTTLSNYELCEKLKILDSEISKVKCSYSGMFIANLKDAVTDAKTTSYKRNTTILSSDTANSFFEKLFEKIFNNVIEHSNLS